jgi:hypothetical protein
LLDGTVLVAGGQDGQHLDLDSAEVYDPGSNTFSLLPARMGTPRSGDLGLYLLNNGKVLIGGGTSGGHLASTIEVYDPVTRVFATVGSPDTARQLFAANFLVEPYTGVLLATGGLDSADRPLASSEAFFYPTLRSDKRDYSPGETVILTGERWVPGDTITIRIQESSGDPDTYLTTTADADGAFVNSEFQTNPDRLDVGVRFLVTAGGQHSPWTAQAVFTDGNRTFDQCQDDTNDDNVKDPCVWITGDINPGKSAYHEGDSVAFRIWLDGLTPGSTGHTVTIRYDFTKQTTGGVIVLGYDYLTHPDATETATSRRCTDIPGPIGTSETACGAMSGPSPITVPSDGFAFSPSLSGVNTPLAGQAVATREAANPALKQIVLFGGTLTGISSISKVGDPNADSDSQSEVTITFTVGSGTAAACTGPPDKPDKQNCRVNILFGGHLAKGTTDASGWGIGRGASSFPGASISMRMQAIDGDSSGAVNRSIQPGAVLPPALATPALTTIATPAATVGGSISDTAALLGGSGTLGGTVTFTLYGPSDAACSTSIFTNTKPVVSSGGGSGTATSDPFTPSAAGTYRWRATYSGDTNNAGTSTACNDLGETSVVIQVVIKHLTMTTVQCDPTIFPSLPLTRANAMLAWAQRCTATVSDLDASPTTPTGTVSFFVDTSPTAFTSCTLAPAGTTGVASCSVDASIPTGAHVVTATYSGDDTHEGSTGVTPFVAMVVPRAPVKVANAR